MRFSLLLWIISATSFLLTAYVLPGFRVAGFGSALVGALVLGLANFFVRPILFVLTLPLNLLTLGLFTFVLNGIIIQLCAALLPGLEIDAWITAIVGALLISLFTSLLIWLVGF